MIYLKKQDKAKTVAVYLIRRSKEVQENYHRRDAIQDMIGAYNQEQWEEGRLIVKLCEMRQAACELAAQGWESMKFRVEEIDMLLARM